MQKKQISFLLRNYLEPKLSLQKLPFAGTILFLNYPVLELSFAGTILFYNCSLPAIMFLSHRLDPVSFVHLVLTPLCEPKSHLIIAVRARIAIGKHTWKNEFNLFPNIFKYFQIFKTNIQLYLIISSVSCSKFKYKISGT